ncbi:MAG: hypothetical protein K940chlam8_00534 [Chlamydiae bacterium]|nr:hypothetical protein [Chlamydiota bacterium]
MRCCVVGAGLTGLALCVDLLEKNYTVTLVDDGNVLINTFSSELLLGIPEKNQALQALLDLMTTVAPTCFKKIQEGYIVDVAHYLKRLFDWCKHKGCLFEKNRSLESFDLYFFTTPLALIPLYTVKTQRAIVQLKKKPPLPVIKKHYLFDDGKQCVLGQTFEKTFENTLPDLNVVQKQLIETSAFEVEQVLGIEVALRSYHKSYQPLSLQLNHNTYFLGAMGSNELLQHAYFSRKMVANIDTKQKLALQGG